MFFVNNKKFFLVTGTMLMVACALLLAVFGLKVGIDFTGGSLTEVSYDESPEKTVLESKVSDLGFGGVSIRGSVNESGKDAFFIRTKDLNDEERNALESTVTSIGAGASIDRFTSIGPVVGQELRDKAGWAIGGVVLIIVLYVAFAFAGIGTPVSSWIYGLVTILVLIHDVLLPTAFMSLLGQITGAEVDVLFVMALLAVLGYSVNDTIVIFDRVRENLIKNRTEKKTQRTEPGGVVIEEVEYTLTAPYDQIVGSAVSETMARSINTSLTTLIALIALYFVGGTVTQTFALVLMIGVLAGAYSSICIAAPLVVAYAEYQAKKMG